MTHNNNRWLSLSLLAIILPTTLLVTFKLTGIIPEPQQPEALHVLPVDWNMTRPSDYITIDKLVENSYGDGKASARLDVHVTNYVENSPGWPAYGNDYAKLRVTVRAEMEDGFVYSILIKFSGLDSYGHVLINDDSTSYELNNLQICKMRGLLANELKAYLEASPVNPLINRPTNCSISILAYWIFIEQTNVNHSITISLEITYYNGAAYEKVEIPINLGVLKD